MKKFRKRLFAAAGYNTTYFGFGRKEFDPSKPMRTFDEYLVEAALETCKQVQTREFDEGIIGSFMSGRFLKQANLPGFLPHVVPELLGKPCTAVEGACGTGGRAIATAARSILADQADIVFVIGFEVQNGVKAVYGADILAGAGYYQKERKNGQAFFFPGTFAARAGAYYEKYGYDRTRQAMAKWYEQAILNARKNPKAQEFHNVYPDLYKLGMTQPDAVKFIPHLNAYDCSKVTDGASSILILSEEGIRKCGLDDSQLIEIVAIGEAEGDITQSPQDLTIMSSTALAGKKAFEQAGIGLKDVGLLELHDCFSISGLLALEALGFAEAGKSADIVLENKMIPANLSGGLCGFGHPTGATGVRQLVDLQQQLTGQAANQAHIKSPYGMMVSMGGNDVTVTSIIAKKV